MLVIDASALFDMLTDRPNGAAIGDRLISDPDHAAPHIIDVEVFGAIRRDLQRGLLDHTQATHAVTKLAAWPGQRFAQQLLLGRAWELRDTVRGWDAMYVALAEALDAPLVTLDARLAGAPGPVCRIDVIG